MSITRDKISKEVFSILEKSIQSVDREESFDKNKCYIDFSKEDKHSLNTVKGILTIDTIPNDFCVIYLCENTNENCIIVLGNNDFSDDVLEKKDSSLLELCILCEEQKLYVTDSILATEIYDHLFSYEEKNYSGHKFEDLEIFFQPFTVYKINSSSVICEQDGYCQYAYFLLCKAKNSNFPWNEETLKEIENVICSNNKEIPYYNVALTLSSRQWTHIFLESYRIIEHVFFAIYLQEIKDKTRTSLLELASIFENVLNWRPPEEQSIEKIFKELRSQPDFNYILVELENIKSIRVGDMELHRWYYKNIRNPIAHFRIIHNNIEFSNSEWNNIIRFNFMVIEYLYNKYKEEIQN